MSPGTLDMFQFTLRNYIVRLYIVKTKDIITEYFSLEFWHLSDSLESELKLMASPPSPPGS